MEFLPVRVGNLHDPTQFWVRSAPAEASAILTRKSAQNLGSNRPFRLTINYLSYAHFALLRRNIIAFHSAE